MQDRAREGKPQGGVRRFGYSKDGMTIVEEEAEIVREVFDRYLKGEGAAPLAKDLHSRGIRTKTVPATGSSPVTVSVSVRVTRSRRSSWRCPWRVGRAARRVFPAPQ